MSNICSKIHLATHFTNKKIYWNINHPQKHTDPTFVTSQSSRDLQQYSFKPELYTDDKSQFHLLSESQRQTKVFYNMLSIL